MGLGLRERGRLAGSTYHDADRRRLVQALPLIALPPASLN